MPSTYTARARLELQAAGENLSVWGDPKLNNDFKRVDYAVKGLASFALSGSISLTTSNTSTDPAQYQAIAAVLNVTGGTGGTITVPGVEGTWLVRNGASGPVSVTTGSGATAIIASGDTASVLCDATNVYREKQTDIANQRLTNVGAPVASTDAATKAYADGLAFSSSLPNQSGNAGKYLSTDGSNASWQTVLPAFSGTTNYTLISNGSQAVWTSPANARIALGLGGAAVLSVGTSGGTVAAGDDSRITGAMPKTGGAFSGNFSRDSQYIWSLSSGNPLENWDPNDYVYYDRATDRRIVVIAGTARFVVDNQGATVPGRFDATTLTANGQEVYTPQNITYGTAAPGVLPVNAIYLRHA